MSGVPDYPLGATLDFKFTTRQFSDGVPTQLAGTPEIVIYEDNDAAEITAAETLSVDFDARVGLNNLRVVATAANGFESGKSYSAVIITGTVGGTSVVGEVVQQFSIDRAASLQLLPKINTALDNIPFVMVDETDGFTLEPGLTVTVTKSLDGGVTFTATTGTVTEITDGAYTFDATAADVNGLAVLFKFSATGAADRFVGIRTRL